MTAGSFILLYLYLVANVAGAPANPISNSPVVQKPTSPCARLIKATSPLKSGWDHHCRVLGERALSTENYASGRPVTASNNVDAWGKLSYVTDGQFNQFSHSPFETNPWVEVALDGNKQIRLARITFRGQPVSEGNYFDEFPLRNSGYSIHVNSALCAENQGVAAYGGSFTMDSVCGSTLTGNKVRLSLPTGGRRFLMVAELEVYGPDVHSSTTCFSGTQYPVSQPCATCDGSGPSQCKTCNDGHVFVMMDATKKTGGCAVAGDTPYVLNYPGFAPQELSNLTQIYTKIIQPQKSFILLPRAEEMNGVTGEVVGLQVLCSGTKRVICKKDLATGKTTCTNHKTAKFLKYVTDSSEYGGQLITATGKVVSRRRGPTGIINDNFQKYLDLFEGSATELINPCINFVTLL